MANKIKIKRGLKVNLPILSVGEQGFCTDTSEIFIGGSTGNIQLANKEYVDSQLAETTRQIESLLKSEVYVENYPIIPPENNDSGRLQRAINDLESGGVLHVSGKTYTFSGVTVQRPISIKGAGSAVSKFLNSSTGIMISYSYKDVGMTDLQKRSPISIEDIRFEDAVGGTGTAIYMYNTYFVEFNRCHFEGFTNGFGTFIEDGLWIYFNHVTTNKSEIACVSAKTPHFNNQIFFNGGEIRNPSRYGLYIENADNVAFRDFAIEGNATGTAIYGAYIKNARMVSFEEVYSEHIENAQACIKVYNSQAVNVSLSTLTSNSITVPSLLLEDCHMIGIDKCVLNHYPIKTIGTCNGITIKDTALWGKIDIKDGHYYKIENCSPISATIIPVDPRYKSETFDGQGIPFSNHYNDSSFRTCIPTVTNSVGTAVASHDTTTGYYDTNSLKIVGVSNDKPLIQGLGRIETTGQGAIISFMAKAQTEADFEFSPSIAVASGGNKVNVKTNWRRYFVVSLLQETQIALASVHLWVTFSNSNTLWIDDVQVTPINSYNEAMKFIENFRYVPTHGSIILNDVKPIVTYTPYFVNGIQFRKHAYAPTSPQEGTVYFADGTNWNPGDGKGLYLYDGSIYTKL